MNEQSIRRINFTQSWDFPRSFIHLHSKSRLSNFHPLNSLLRYSHQLRNHLLQHSNIVNIFKMKHHIVILLFLFLRTASSLLGLCNPGNTLSTTRPTFFSITKLDASSVADASFSSSFNDRMRDILLKESNKLKRKSNNNKSNRRPKNLMLVKTLQEYKDVLQSDREKIIVVRFFAKWCKVSYFIL